MLNQTRLINEFLELVKITSTGGKERQIAGYLKKRISSMGFSVIEDDAGKKVSGQAGNLIVKLPPAGASNCPLLLCAHMDTVEPAQGVQPVIENGVIRSLGKTILGADDKAGIAAILELLWTVKENNLEHSGLEVVFTVWEEGGLLGSKNLDFKILSSRTGFVLDSEGKPGTIVTAGPSQDKIRAKIKGRAAHAGINPEEGINAIQVASLAISSMKLGRIDEETTANIGIIRGGKATNIIPDLVLVEGEARSLNRSKLKAQTKAMCKALDQAALKTNAEVDIYTETIYFEFNLPEDSKGVQIASKAAKNLGFPVKLIKSGGGSDANIFNQYGIKCANLGIGMQKIHTTDEFILVEDLVNSLKYLLEIIKVAKEND